MNNAKYTGRVGALAVALGVGIAAANTPAVALAEPTDSSTSSSSDLTALILGGTSVPTPDDAYIETVRNHFIAPTHPGQDIEYVAVTTPEEGWPVTGLLRLIGLAVGPQSVWGPGGAGWPDEPWWKLSGLFDLTYDQSFQAGVGDLEQAMAKYGNDHLVIYGYSQGAVIANLEKRKLAEQYPPGTKAPDIDFVLSGDANVPNGGIHARFPGLYVPIGWTLNGPEPTDTQFHTDVITRQYDGLADFPLYPLNLVADLNALLGLAYVHLYDLDVSLPADPTTSKYYQGTYGDTSYYFFETPDLPLFAPLRMLGVPEPLIDVVEPFFREIVELGYDRSIPPWQPTPARLIPMHDPVTVAADLVEAIEEGTNNAPALIGSPAPLRSPPAARVAPLGPADAAPNLAIAGISAKVTVSEAAAQQNPAASTGRAAQTSPTVSTEPTTQQDPMASTQTAGNASEPSAKPKPKPSETTLTPKAPEPAGRQATQRPVGQPTHDVSVPRDGQPTTAGDPREAAPKAGSTLSPSSTGLSSTTSSAGGSPDAVRDDCESTSSR